MSGGNFQKTWLADSLNRFAERKVGEAIQNLGRALPCSVVSRTGQIVTVKFEVQSGYTLPQITIPIATSAYDWLPIQAGDEGVTFPADAYLGGISGLGGGTADLRQRGNLSTLMFMPCAKKAWAAGNTNQRVVQGPDGVLVQTTTGSIYIDLTGAGIAIKGNVTVTGSITATGDVIATSGANQVSLTNHVHSGVQTGAGDSGPPVPGT